jgi:hypothetical protein
MPSLLIQNQTSMNNRQQLQYPFFKRLVTTPSLQFLLDMVSVAKNEIIIVSPWITRSTLQKIIDATKHDENIRWKVLTRGNHDDFCEGLSDIDAFKLMIENKSFDLRANRRLHAKVYIVDGELSLVTSANLTENGMRLNPEVGVASQEPSEASELIKELSKWFSEAIRLDQEWLDDEQKKLSASKKNDIVETPFDPTNYHHLEETNKRTPFGKYRELPLPEVWRPLLDSLKETKLPHPDYLTVNDMIPTFDRFFEYLGAIRDGKKHRERLVDWLVQKQTLDKIGDAKTRESVSRKIGNRKDLPENIWNSGEGQEFTRQISLFLNNAIVTTDLRVSEVLSFEQLQPLGLSPVDLCQFVCGMVKNKIILGNYHAELTPTNQLLICDKEVYSVLKGLDHIFRAESQEFLEFERFCQLGELKKVSIAWFCPDFQLLKNLYLTKNGKIGCRNWNIEKFMQALAWELADKLDYYYWHFSEMREALKYLFPTKFGETSIHYVSTRVASSLDKFQFAGSRGYWQLADLGDGYHNNKDAVTGILSAAGTPLHYKEVIKELRRMGRRVNEGSIYALLDRDEAFKDLGEGNFRLKL